MKMIQCISPKTSGTLHVFGMDTTKEQRNIKMNIGVVPQENNLDPDFTVYENLNNYSRYFNIKKNEAKKRIEVLLDFVRLDEKRDMMPEALSGGMKRRLILARALINEPQLIILDEPTVGLDPQARHLIWEKLLSLKKKGITILMTTHYLDEAEKLCDRLVFMDNGKIVIHGKPVDIIREQIGTDIVEIDNTPDVIKYVQKANLNYEIVDDYVIIYTNHPKEITQNLSAQYNFDRINTRKATLEDVFLKFTGRKLRE